MELTRVTSPGPTLVALERGPDDLAVHVVDNGDLRLAFLPGVGGRLISVRCGGSGVPDRGTELLWRNPEYLDEDLRTVRPRATWAPLDAGMGSWANVGGAKTWPAPQGWSGPDEWPGPPDPVLDSGGWAVESETDGADGGLVVRLTSPDDLRTGLRAVREFAVPARGTTFTQHATFTNVSDRPVRWAVWEVAQVDAEAFAAPGRAGSATPGGAASADAGLWVGVRGVAQPVHLVDDWGRIAVADPTDGRRRVVVGDVVAKVGFLDASGTLELRRPDGAGVRWAFDVPDGEYPDGGCAAEVWMQYPTPDPLDGPGSLHPSARLVELEALTPLTRLAPGESVTQRIVWTVTPPA